MSIDEVPQWAATMKVADRRLVEDDVPELEVTNFERPKVPITLLTGYLGAGKSTLLEYIMKENHGYRIAVCMNDFGDTTDIEAKSMQMSNDDGSTSSNMLTLPNGCLCCSFKDMGIAAIEEMVAQQRDKVDWVVVELTGLADPAPIAKSFWENEEMGDLVLDSVVCVVDCRNVLKQLDEARDDGSVNEAQKQVACADVILLNKTDLVTPAQVDEVARTVARINPTLRVHQTTRSQVPLPELFNLRAYTSPVVSELHPPECTEDHDHSTHHTHHITTMTIDLPVLTMPQFDALNTFLETFLWDGRVPPLPDGSASGAHWEGAVPEILRTKGYAVLEDGSARVIQGVADIFDVRSSSAEDVKNTSGDPKPKIVFIGRGVDARLEAVVRSFLGIA